MQKVTLQDLASRLGVSRSTVSRALRGDPQIAVPTQERVRDLAREVGYHPNHAARALNRRRSGAVGLLFPRSSSFVFSNPYFTELLAGLSDVAERNGLPLTFSTSPNPPYEAWLREGRVDGLITLGGSVEAHEAPLLNRLVADGYPVVALHSGPRALQAVTIGCNERAGIWQAAQHLAELGHRRVAFLAGPRSARYARTREKAYRQALDVFGLEPDEALVVRAEDTERTGEGAIGVLAERGTPFTGIIANNDLLAIGAVRGLAQRGRRVPGDVSVVGFDDIRLAAMLEPPLTTVRQPIRELGERAMTALCDLIDGKRVESTRLATQLVVRETTGAPA